MSILSPDILAGFLVEARGYIHNLRGILAESQGAPDPESLQELYVQVFTLHGAAVMLELDEVAALASAAEAMLEERLEKRRTLTKKNQQMLASTLNRIEKHIKALTPPEVESPAETDAPGGIGPPSVSLELQEIFALEAQEHNQTIQNGLERLRKDPADTETLSEVRRATHTLKGAAAAVGFEDISRLAHLMEDLIERFLEGGETLTAEATALLFDSADTLEALVEPEESQEARARVGSFDARFAEFLGEASTSPAPVVPPTVTSGEAEPPQARAPEGLLRIALPDIDQLINRVGEIVINHAAFEGQLGTLDDLLVELDHATRRLRRVTHDIDSQIATSPLGTTDSQGSSFEAFDPLELERYTLLHQLMRELEEVTADTDGVNKELQILADDLDAALTRERRLTAELQDGLMATRLVSFHEIETRLRRTVRRAARDLDKEVELELVGFETEVDKTILDALVDPLMHMLRNAVDHGIEEPAVRKAAGKPPTGQIALHVSRARGRVLLKMSDDGAGIDLDQVRERGVAAGLLAEGPHPGEDRLLGLLFEEGFSLAKTVTQTSGRGLGLNIVRRAVRGLQGTVRVETVPGRGSTFDISVPITLAITRALFIRSGDQEYAVPLEQISAVLRLPADTLDGLSADGILHHEGRALSTYDLSTFGDLPETSSQTQRYGLVVESGERATAMLTDGLVGTREAVIKSLGTHLRRVHGISGATIAGDGRVVLILDVIELIESEHGTYQWADASPPKAPEFPTSDGLHVLVVDDSLSVRRVVCSFLVRAGWQATPAKDGIEALEKLAALRPDVALVDIEMPRMNGYELLSRIKSEPKWQDIPVVFLTSRSAAKHRERATQLNVDGYMVKPYREEELLQELRRVTEKEA